MKAIVGATLNDGLDQRRTRIARTPGFVMISTMVTMSTMARIPRYTMGENGPEERGGTEQWREPQQP